ncbi:hypothetical protein T440DRAFT_349808, partial [Plenodomus tracheiphilus IPT5]
MGWICCGCGIWHEGDGSSERDPNKSLNCTLCGKTFCNTCESYVDKPTTPLQTRSDKQQKTFASSGMMNPIYRQSEPEWDEQSARSPLGYHTAKSYTSPPK